MNNVGKNRLVKVIFTNVHKISDACANSFARYIMIAQCMRNGFTLYYNFKFLWKNGLYEKIKAHLLQQPQITTIFQPPTFKFYSRKLLAPPPFKEGRDYVTDYNGKTIKLLPSYMTDFLFTELQSHNI